MPPSRTDMTPPLLFYNWTRMLFEPGWTAITSVRPDPFADVWVGHYWQMAKRHLSWKTELTGQRNREKKCSITANFQSWGEGEGTSPVSFSFGRNCEIIIPIFIIIQTACRLQIRSRPQSVYLCVARKRQKGFNLFFISSWWLCLLLPRDRNVSRGKKESTFPR